MMLFILQPEIWVIPSRRHSSSTQCLLESYKNVLIYKRKGLTLREDGEEWRVIAGLNAIGAPQSDTPMKFTSLDSNHSVLLALSVTVMYCQYKHAKIVQLVPPSNFHLVTAFFLFFLLQQLLKSMSMLLLKSHHQPKLS